MAKFKKISLHVNLVVVASFIDNVWAGLCVYEGALEREREQVVSVSVKINCVRERRNKSKEEIGRHWKRKQ